MSAIDALSPGPDPPPPAGRTLVGATDVCTLLEGEVVDPVTMPGLAEGPVEEGEVLVVELLVVEVPPRSVDEPRSEDEEALEDASAVVVEPDDDVDESPAESALAVPPEVPPLPLVPPEVVELLVAAACGGGALDAAAKMKFGVGT